MRLLDRLRDGDEAATDCRCVPSFRSSPGTDRVALVVDADDCTAGGDLSTAPGCRATVIDALADRDAADVRVRRGGRERVYDDGAVGLLVAAGRFAARVAVHDETLAGRARRDPLGAARVATGRAGPVANVAATSGLAAGADRVDGGYERALRATVGPTVSNARLAERPPSDATLVDRRDLDTRATVRRYRTDAGGYYLLEPLESRLDAAEMDALQAAYDCLANPSSVDGAGRPVARAVRAVEATGGEASAEAVERVLRKQTRGLGVLEDVFADPEVSEVLVTAPVSDNPVRVSVDGDRLPTNVRLTRAGVASLASRFRRESGRAFSRATPTLDARTETLDGGRVRVAGVTDPASDGYGFVFRTHGTTAWTLPALVANGTLPADAAALCSVAVERAAAGLIAGPRGAGKTTLLSALLWELPPTIRTVVVEDTPELPTVALRDADRDVQPVRIETGDEDGPALSADEALRTALRLGEGALVVGEVRGAEAATLYEAMRVGAAGSAVLGTIHGDGAAAVFERVVTDLDVPASSFAATDLLVTLSVGDRRRVAAIEEVRPTDDGVAFEPLFDAGHDGAEPTGVVERGNSELVASLARPGESYADVLDELDEREALLADLAATERTAPEAVDSAHRERVTE